MQERIAIEDRKIHGVPVKCLVIYDDPRPAGTETAAPMLLDEGTRQWLLLQLQLTAAKAGDVAAATATMPRRPVRTSESTMHVFRVFNTSAHDYREVRASSVEEAQRVGAALLGCAVEQVVVRYVVTKARETR